MPHPTAQFEDASHLPSNPHRLVAVWMDEDRQYRAMAQRQNVPSLPHGQSEAIRNRVLCTYDALFKGAEQRGHIVGHAQDYVPPPWLLIGKERVEIMVRERMVQRRVALTAEELNDPRNVAMNRRWKQPHIPTGTLQLEATAAYRRLGKQRWEDAPGLPLEEQIEAILPELERIAQEAAARRREDGDRERRWIMQSMQKQRREVMAAHAQHRWDLARKAAADWKEAEIMRNFLDAVEARWENPPRRVAAWLKWARVHADEMDPMAGSAQQFASRLMPPVRERKQDGDDALKKDGIL